MNNQEMINVLVGMQSLDNLVGLDFFYEVLKIEDIFQSENKIIQKTLKSLKDLGAYENERNVILEKYCEKDEKGRAVKPSPNSFKIDAALADDLNAELATLDEKYKDSLGKKKALLEQECKAKFKKIKLSLVPKNILGSQYRVIKDLVKE